MAISTAVLQTNLLSGSGADITITSGGQNSAYPKANMDDAILGKPYRSTGLTLIIDIDLGSAKAADACAILNHNVSAAATLIRLASGSTFPPSDFTYDFTYRADHMYVSFASATKRYWRLSITDAGNSDGYLEIGELVLGAKTTLTRPYSYGWSRARQFENTLRETLGGVRHVFERFSRWQYALPFQAMSAAEIAEVLSIYETQKMDLTPFVFIPDLADDDVVYARIMRPLSIEATTRGMFAGELVLEEESSSVSISAAASATPVRRTVWFDEDVIEVSGSPLVTVAKGVTVVRLPDTADSEISAWFKVPNDADVSQDILLLLNYAAQAAPGATNNKVKLKTTATVNDTAAGITAGDAITLTNNTNWGKYTATANLVAGGSYAVGDIIQFKILRDTTVANNAATGFDLGRIAWSYVPA